jgi:fructose-1,6-bisphosphatase I
MKGMTIERHILQMERDFPEATGTFSDILHGIAAAGRRIGREVRRAGLTDILGEEGSTNVHGEAVKKLDLYAHDALVRALDHRGHLCAMASEEEEYLLPIPEHHPTGSYCLLFDPLDGSSNIDVNVTVGTIFSVHRKVSEGDGGRLQDCLQPGRRQVAAGYVVYGSSTMLVYTTGAGVHGFTLDPGVGEFLLSHERIVIPEPGERVCSVNAGHYHAWSPAQQALFEALRRPDDGGEPFGFRYVGSMVADVHRILLEGGLFMYPAEKGSPAGKLRLLYEAAPLGMVVEQAGGRASDGRRPILDLVPHELHQRTPVFLGSRSWVERAEAALTPDRPD